MAARESSGPVVRSISPSSRFNRQSSGFASATTSTFTSTRSIHKPTAVNHLYKYDPTSLGFSIDRSSSANRSTAFSKPSSTPPVRKRTCMCSPTNHPGSFRCSLHKGLSNNNNRVSNNNNNCGTTSCRMSTRLNMRRSAMKNSLVRIGTVEGDLFKRALGAQIRPSSHQQRRRGEFRRRPTKLSVMSKV